MDNPSYKAAIEELMGYDGEQPVSEKEKEDLINIRYNNENNYTNNTDEREIRYAFDKGNSTNSGEEKVNKKYDKGKDKGVNIMKELENRFSGKFNERGSNSEKTKKSKQKSSNVGDFEMKTVKKKDHNRKTLSLFDNKKKRNSMESKSDSAIHQQYIYPTNISMNSIKEEGGGDKWHSIDSGKYERAHNIVVPGKTIADTVMMKSFTISKARGKRTTQTLKRDDQLLARVDTLRRDFATLKVTASPEIPEFWRSPVTPRAYSRYYSLQEGPNNIKSPFNEGDSVAAGSEALIADWVTALTHRRLEEDLGINFGLIQRVSSGNIALIILKDLPLLRATLEKLNLVLESGDEHPLFKKLSVKISQAVMQSGFRNHNLSEVSDPEIYLKLPHQLIQVYSRSTEVAIEELRNKEIVRYLDGSIKEKVALWWLNLIQTGVDNFLGQLSYDFNAVPQDYTSEPPKDIEVVKNNLQLIEECLNPANDIHNVAQLMDELKSQINPIIDDFVHEALIVLSDCLSNYIPDNNFCIIPKENNIYNRKNSNDSSSNSSSNSNSNSTKNNTNSTCNHSNSDSSNGTNSSNTNNNPDSTNCNNENNNETNNIRSGNNNNHSIDKMAVLDLDTIDQILSGITLKETPKIDDHVYQLVALAKDLRYLYRMRELEDATRATEKLMDAVPVTGLILARLCTLENELRTVVELWENRIYSSKEITESEDSFAKPEGPTVKTRRSDSSASTGSSDGETADLKRCISYKGNKKQKDDTGMKLLTEGGLFSKHGKKAWPTPIRLRVASARDYVICENPESKAELKKFPLKDLVDVQVGKNSHFLFYAAERHCFSLIFRTFSPLLLETKSTLDRDKWVASFRWLLATQQIKIN